MSADFESSLDESLDTVTEPGLYPDGTWLLKGVAWMHRVVDSKFNDSGRQDLYTLIYSAIEPSEDVDSEAVEQGDYEGRRIFAPFYVGEPRDKLRLKNHLEMSGIDTSGRTFKEALDAGFRGSLVYGMLGRKTRENREGELIVENTVKDFARAA